MTIIEDIVSPDSGIVAPHWLRRRTATGLKIEHAALRLFLMHGPTAVSTDQIAAAAGISRRTFFRYFRTRDDILVAQPARQLVASTQAVCHRPAEESLIEALLNTTREFSAADDDIARLSQQLMVRYPTFWQESIGELRRLMDELYEEMVGHRLRIEGADAGAIAAGLAAIVIHTYTRWVNQGCMNNFADALEQALRGFVALVSTVQLQPFRKSE